MELNQNSSKVNLNTVFMTAIYLITNECEALSSCRPLCFQRRMVNIPHWRLVQSLKCKLRAIPEWKRCQLIRRVTNQKYDCLDGRCYLKASSADLSVPLTPLYKSGSGSRWHWLRKSQQSFKRKSEHYSCSVLACVIISVSPQISTVTISSQTKIFSDLER